MKTGKNILNNIISNYNIAVSGSTPASFLNVADDRDEYFNMLLRWYNSLLCECGLALSLKEIKKKNIIEIENTELDGRWRDPMNEILRLREDSKEIIDATAALPVFTEGVIKQKIKDDKIYYIHFYAKTKEDGNIVLDIDLYLLNAGAFYFMFGMWADYDPYFNKQTGDYRWYTGIDAINKIKDKYKINPFNDEETEHLKDYFETISNQSFTEKVFNLTVRTFKAINCIKEFKKQFKQYSLSNNASEKKLSGNKVVKLGEVSTTERKKQVICINNIKIFVNDPDKVSRTRQNEIIRRTGVWEVCGHYRTYRNGKRVYVNGYRKGPERNKECKTKTTLRIV